MDKKEYIAICEDIVTGKRIDTEVVEKLSNDTYCADVGYGTYKATIYTRFDLTHSNRNPQWKIDGKTYLRSEVTEPIMKIVKKHYAYRPQQEKVAKLLELYRLKDDLIEEYQVTDNILERQQALGAITDVREEIQGIEEELK